MEEKSNGEDGGWRVPALSLDSPWAWFYYSTFAVQVVIVTANTLRHRIVADTSNTALDNYIAILAGVSAGVPAMAAYSLLLAVTVEATRMIAERYLAKRFRQGKQEGIVEGRTEGIVEGRTEGIAEVLEMLDENTRKEVERKLRRNGSSNYSSGND